MATAAPAKSPLDEFLEELRNDPTIKNIRDETGIDIVAESATKTITADVAAVDEAIHNVATKFLRDFGSRSLSNLTNPAPAAAPPTVAATATDTLVSGGTESIEKKLLEFGLPIWLAPRITNALQKIGKAGASALGMNTAAPPPVTPASDNDNASAEEPPEMAHVTFHKSWVKKEEERRENAKKQMKDTLTPPYNPSR